MLDSKARLVLPLEIRDAIKIKPGEKILLSVSAANEGKMTLVLAKAPNALTSDEVIISSKNAAYVKRKNGGANYGSRI